MQQLFNGTRMTIFEKTENARKNAYIQSCIDKRPILWYNYKHEIWMVTWYKEEMPADVAMLVVFAVIFNATIQNELTEHITTKFESFIESTEYDNKSISEKLKRFDQGIRFYFNKLTPLIKNDWADVEKLDVLLWFEPYLTNNIE